MKYRRIYNLFILSEVHLKPVNVKQTENKHDMYNSGIHSHTQIL